MSIDPNKAFGMKATNKSYTLEFKRDAVTGVTEVSAVDSESRKMTIAERFSAAIAILLGKKTLGEMVFPINLRNSDFYHLSYIYRPKVDDSVKQVAKAERPKTTKPAKTAKPSTEEPTAAKKPRKKPGRKPVIGTETNNSTATPTQNPTL